MQNHAPTIYAYAGLDELLAGEARGGAKTALPGSTGKPVTERPDWTSGEIENRTLRDRIAARPTL